MINPIKIIDQGFWWLSANFFDCRAKITLG
jgi:hypothetical protein